MGTPQSLVWAAMMVLASTSVAVSATSEPREPCIPPGTYSPALPSFGRAEPGGGEPVVAEGLQERGTTAPGAEDVPPLDVPCREVGSWWPSWPGAERSPEPPELAVVMTDFRPKDVRLFLDGRAIGRARAFNGRNGFLFLEPGEYRLEAQLGGYQPVAFRIVAHQNCRFDIRHRMQRIAGATKERSRDVFSREEPLQRVYGPRTAVEEKAAAAAPGPDLSLRPNLSERPRTSHRSPARSASLRLQIAPPSASVSLDGEFVATGEELGRLIGPLAIVPGDHVLEVSAPGYEPREVEFVARLGEITELSVTLLPQGEE